MNEDAYIAHAQERHDTEVAAQQADLDDAPSVADRLDDAASRLREELAKNPQAPYAFVGRDTLTALAAWLEADAIVARAIDVTRDDAVLGFVEGLTVADTILWDEP